MGPSTPRSYIGWLTVIQRGHLPILGFSTALSITIEPLLTGLLRYGHFCYPGSKNSIKSMGKSRISSPGSKHKVLALDVSR